MTPWLSSALANHLWQSTILVGIVWLATLTLRRNRARVRFWLWTAASVKFLMPFAWLVNLGAQFEWRSTPAIAQPAVSFVVDDLLSPPMMAAAVSSAAVPEETFLPWILAGAWMVGSVAVLLWWWRQWIPVRAAFRRATPLRLDLPYDTGGLAVMSSPAMFEPAVIGIWRPVLLLPEALVDRLTSAQLNAVVAHERCHVRCHDNLVAAVHMAVEAIFWFHPMVWWIESRLIEERERACDEEVLRSGSSPDDYAEGILEVCRASVGSPVACVAGVSGSDLRRRIESIMRGDPGRPMTAAKRLALLCVSGAVVCAPIAAGALSAPSQGRAQAPPANLQFEVASIRRNVSAEQRPPGFNAAPNGQLTVQNMTLFNIIRNTYDVQGVQIVPGANTSDWFERDRWDIVAKAPEGIASRPQMMAMMQNLLATRFKLVVRPETREMPVYALVLARSDRQLGPQLRQSDGQCEAARLAAQKGIAPLQTPEVERGFCGSRSIAGLIRMSGVALTDFARYLAPQTGRFVIDRTGLTGTFDLDLTWTSALAVPAKGPQSAFNDGSSLFTALQEQLGLKLEAQRAPVEVFVIESAERPTEN